MIHIERIKLVLIFKIKIIIFIRFKIVLSDKVRVISLPESGGTDGTLGIVILIEPGAEDTARGVGAANLNAFAAPAFAAAVRGVRQCSSLMIGFRDISECRLTRRI